jgi:Skp family chaperone for outer membrane proteins
MERTANWNSQWMRWIVTALAVCLGIFVWEALSDEPPAAAVRPHQVPVALLDIAKVFKGASAFNARMQEIKDEIGVYEKEVDKKRADIEALRPKKDGSGLGSGANVGEDVIAKLQAALQAEITLKRKSFLDMEAAVYAETYASIEKAVEQIAKARDVGVVLRYQSEKMDAADRASVLQGVNRAVVYSDVPDLTKDVLAALNGN